MSGLLSSVQLRAPNLSLIFFVLLSGLAPSGHAGVIGVYEDPSGSCMVADTQPSAITAYVIHRTPPWELGVVGSAFRLVAGGGFSGTLISSDFMTFLTLGDLATGVEVAYGGCVNDQSVLVVRATYQLFGNSPGCSYLAVQAHPASGTVEIWDCGHTMEPASATSSLVFNADASCQCGVLPITTSTWGTIKALYH